MNPFKNLKIWQRAVELATRIYKHTQGFPEEEKYALISQMRRCAVSISSNIAEGAGRNKNKDFKRFLSIAYGSSYKLETQIIIATNLKFINSAISNKLGGEVDELQKMIYSFSNQLSSK